MKPTQEQIEKVTEEALLAFWAVVAEKFPEVKTGDFPITDTMTQSDMSEAFIRTWIHYNYPKDFWDTTEYWQELGKKIAETVTVPNWTLDIDTHTKAIYWCKDDIQVYAHPFYEDEYDGLPIDVDSFGDEEFQYSVMIDMENTGNAEHDAKVYNVLINDYLKNMENVVESLDK